MASSEPWLKVWAEKMRGDPELALALGLAGQMLLVQAWDISRDEPGYGELRRRDGTPYTAATFATVIPGLTPDVSARWWKKVITHGYADLMADGALYFPKLEKYQRGSQAAVRKARQRDRERGVNRDRERDSVTPNVTGEERREKREEGDSLRSSPSARRRDPIWDALVEHVGPEPQTPSGRGAWNKAARELRDLDIDVRLIAAAVAEHRRRWPNVDPVTPTSLAKHWTGLVVKANGRVKPSEQEMGDLEQRAREKGFA